MKAQELREKSDEELEEIKKELKINLLKSNTAKFKGKIPIKSTKRNIARINTIFRERKNAVS